MEFVDTVFPIILYILGSILLVSLIVLVLKLIYTVDKTNEILYDVERKVKSFDGLFNAINMTTSTISTIGDRLIEGVSGVVSKIFRRKKKKEEDIYE